MQYKLLLKLEDALGLSHERFESLYDKRLRPLVEYTAGLRALGVPEQLSVAEAMLLYKVWKDDWALVSWVLWSLPSLWQWADL
ncbi:hypothetical protein C0993_011045 [Termitomyces sp. T159_Od127]|nr:hypothetical protein C0993_011045 [Termitomyces sp. T159_Od127]